MPLFEGVQGENEARSIQFDVTPWVEELGDGAVTATAKRSQDSQPYPVTVTKDGNTVTWKPTSTDTAFAGVGSFQLEYTVDSVLAKTCIWSTMVAPSLDPAGDPPDPYENWLAEMRQIAADAMQSAADAEQSAEDAAQSAAESLANQYAAFIVKSASGNIASFNDGADNVPVKSVQVTITPKQSGSGDPSPSNVRPITGWSTVNLSQSAFGECAPNPITGKNIFVSDKMNVLVPCHIPASTAIVVSAEGTTAPVFRYYDANKSEIDYWTLSQHDGNRNYKAITTLSRTTEYVQFTGATNTKFMIELGSTPTSYEPYGTTTPVPLGQTVYGGTLDVTTGELTIDRISADLGAVSWQTRYTGSTNNTLSGVLPSEYRGWENDPEFIGEKYSQKGNANGAGSLSNPDDRATGFWFLKNPNAQTTTTLYMIVPISETPSGKAVYKLATPITVQLTPTQVATLLGTNNVWADCGSVAVEYRADPTLAYNELTNVIVSLGGNL